ncbi:MAG: 2-C-methyl-D-erythritol 2,4-cyclodiphosphate synthase [Candidatus Gastranaerophilales bacterium]|nr:2-C-methyl-D-erythritol 2,4-cyclodiphosphate synthase [Candidatus Gastranaerophilales bacterium]
MENVRIGQGYDIHELVSNRKLVIGGVTIPYIKGLLGHSDADVLIHAIIDAMLGALSLGDIGTHFPPDDELYRNISSLKLLEHVNHLILDEGYTISNLDSTIIAQKPKMNDYIPLMRQALADTLKVAQTQISIKAKTNEKLDSMGEGRSVAAQAVVLLIKR